MPLSHNPATDASSLTSGDREFQVYAVAGDNASKIVHCRPKGEVWLWQFSGTSRLSVYSPSSILAVEHHPLADLPQLTTAKLKSDSSPEKTVSLSKLDSQLIPIDTPFSITPEKIDNAEASVTIVIAMVPLKRSEQQL